MTITLQQIDDTGDYNFIYNNVCVAVALLQTNEYYLYFFDRGYDEKEVNLCFESLKLLNENLKQEKSE